jgi:hypothetical protein
MTQQIGPWERYGLPEPIERPLRFGLLVDGMQVQSWQAACIERLIDSGVASPALVIVPAGRPVNIASKTTRRMLRDAAYRASCATLWRSRSGRSASIGPMVEGVGRLEAHTRTTRTPWVAIEPDDVARIREADLDFLLAFGFGLIEGDILESARHGVWSFHHGDERRYRGLPAAFWELFDGSKEIGVALQRLSSRLDAGTILKRGIVAVEPASYGRTLDGVHLGAIDFPMLVCRDILLGRAGYLSGPPLSTSAPLRHLPGTAAVLRVHGKVAAAAVRRVLYGAFVLRRWSVGRLEGGAKRVLDGNLAGTRWRDTGGRTRFQADPMLVPGTGGRVMLFEQYDYRVGRGTIARAVEEPGGTASQPTTTLIDEPGVHLSYPAVVALDDGSLVCTPEAGATGGLVAYRLSAGADSVLAREALVSGFAALDPTIFRFDGRWWLACTADPTSNSHLWLFHAGSPGGPWRAHAGNPVVMDAGSARPAGAPFVHEGSLYRPAQDCRGGYGNAVTLSRVVTLTPNEFDEEPVAHIRPEPNGSNPDGLHTISIDGDAIAIDGYRNVVHPLAGWWRLRALLRRRAGG